MGGRYPSWAKKHNSNSDNNDNNNDNTFDGVDSIPGTLQKGAETGGGEGQNYNTQRQQQQHRPGRNKAFPSVSQDKGNVTEGMRNFGNKERLANNTTQLIQR